MTTILNVDGMSCEHCVKAVTGAVTALDGISSVSVDLAAKTVTIDHAPTVAVSAIEDAIEEQGFEIIEN